MREYGPMLARIAASYARDPARRDDLVQDISIVLWQALPKWRGEASLRTYIARIAHNRAIDQLGKYRNFAESQLDVEHPAPDGDPLHHAESRQRRDRLMEAVRKLPLGMRQTVVLALEGFSQREIGEALGVAENAVAQRLRRARLLLRDTMGVPA